MDALLASKSLVASLLQNLEAHRAFDEERCSSARRGYEPLDALREAEMIGEVIVQLPGVFEGDRVPQPSAAARAEELAAKDVADRAIRHGVIRLRRPLGSDRPDHRTARGLGANPRRDTRIRTRVDEDSSIDEDPLGLLEGIDHALVRNSSERPREDHHVE